MGNSSLPLTDLDKVNANLYERQKTKWCVIEQIEMFLQTYSGLLGPSRLPLIFFCYGQIMTDTYNY